MPSRLEPFEPYLPPRLVRLLRDQARRWRRTRTLPRHLPTFGPDDIEEIRALMCSAGTTKGGPWDRLRDAHMPLPDWFRMGLDPWSAEYRAQQERLWQLITGIERPYDPDADEGEIYATDGTDAIRQPAYYMRRDVEAIASAGDHVLAMGMFLKHSGLVAGDRALEFGAGFGQTALALARLGVNVDTVDISANFCRWVQVQADFFRVPLRAHQGQFGTNPRPGTHYQLIWFYESFHHCWNFDVVVPKLADMLAEGGRVILGGEPVFEDENPAVPYPWGVRLHSEVAAVMRQTRWMELGFSERFLFELFERSGFKGSRIDCPSSLFGRLFVFERAPRPGPGPVTQRWQADGHVIRTEIGTLASDCIRAELKQGFVCYGPYAPVASGEWWALVELAEQPSPRGQVCIDVASNGGSRRHAARWLQLEGLSRLQVWFSLPEACEDLEIRVYADSRAHIAVRSVAIARPNA